MKKYYISIIGAGYVGLSTAIGFASRGYKVIASDIDNRKITSINKGMAPFYEPNLNNLLQKVVRKGNLKCTLDRQEAVLDTEVTFITVGTPNQPDGSINLKHVKNAASEIGKILNKKDTYHLVVVKSTVIPGTTENVVKPILEKHSKKQCGTDFSLCMNPEFLREGSVVHDILHPDRIIIGEHDQKSGNTLERLYQGFYGEQIPPTVRTNLATAEIIKYANNAFLATKISFINQIANICQKISGVDVNVVAKAIGLDKRIGSSFLNAGLGYGGSCLPKDVNALIAFSKKLGYNSLLFNAVQKINDRQPYRAVELAKKKLGNLKDKRIAVLGLAFKPDTDDMREAVSVKIINRLLEEGANVIAYDPKAIPHAKSIFKNKIKYADTAVECITNAECCILVTEWGEFKKLTPEKFIRHMKNPVVIDGRRVYDPKHFKSKLEFSAVGFKNNRKKES